MDSQSSASSKNTYSRPSLRQRMQQNKKPKTSKPDLVFPLSQDSVGICVSPEQLQKLKSEAQQQIQNMISNFYQNKNCSFLWLIVIKEPTQPIRKRLHKLRQTLFGGPIDDQDQHLVPFVQNVNQAKVFLSARNCVFNVIVDLQSAEEFLKIPDTEEKLFSIHLYLKDKDKESIRKANQIKESCKKVRGFYFDLNPLFDRAEIDLQDGTQFLRQEGQTRIDKWKKSYFPSFLKLKEEYSSEVTGYRYNAYAAIKLKDDEENAQERRERLDEFTNLAKRIHLGSQNQQKFKKDLERYLQIKHINCQLQEQQKKHRQILQFYSEQSFYFDIPNNILRACRSVEEFGIVTIPFNQNYNAVKYFYEKNYPVNANNNRQIPYKKLYRCAPLKHVDFLNLKQGEYIEPLGFMSTSKSEEVARSFIKNSISYYMFVFNMPENLKIPTKLKHYDHGFVDFSKAGVKAKIEKEQEVLLNALNIYKVTQIIKPEQTDDVGIIHLEYGAIFDLYQRNANNQILTSEEQLVLRNYMYCMKEFKNIKNLGDVLLKQQKLDQCQKYYEQKIKKQPTPQNYNKLAQVLLKQGKIEGASTNAKSSLTTYQQRQLSYQNLTQDQRQQIVQIQTANKQILVENQDTFNALRAINFAIGAIDKEKGWLLLGQKLMERGLIYLKEGNLLKSEQEFNQAQKIILKKMKQFQSEINKIQLNYKIKNWFSCHRPLELSEQHKNIQITKVNNKYPQLSKNKDKVIELLLKINQCQQKTAQKLGNKTACQKIAKKAKKYFGEMSQPQTENKFEIAKRKILESKMESSFHKPQNKQKAKQLVQQAIQVFKQLQPMSPIVGEYTNLIALMKKQQLKGQMQLSDQQQGKQSKQYNKKQQEQKINSAIEDFQNALEVMIHNKSKDHPTVFQIKNNIGEIEYERSKFEQAIRYAKQVMESDRAKGHSQGAKSALLICKARLSEGQTKLAFGYIDISIKILEKALIKEQGEGTEKQQYKRMMLSHPVYIEIMLFKCKVFNKQTKYDLALGIAQKLLTNAKSQVNSQEGAGCLAGIYEEMASTYFYKLHMPQFLQCAKLALKSRRVQMGKINIPNAIYLCIMAQHMFKTNNDEFGLQYLSEACEIFSRFRINHPFSWLQWSILGQSQMRNNNFEKAQQCIRHSIKILKITHSSNHINVIKMQVKHAEVLFKNDKLEEALPIYKSLKVQIDEKNRDRIDEKNNDELRQTQQLIRRNHRLSREVNQVGEELVQPQHENKGQQQLNEQQQVRRRQENQQEPREIQKKEVKTEKELWQSKIERSLQKTEQKIKKRQSMIHRPAIGQPLSLERPQRSSMQSPGISVMQSPERPRSQFKRQSIQSPNPRQHESSGTKLVMNESMQRIDDCNPQEVEQEERSKKSNSFIDIVGSFFDRFKTKK